MVATAAHRPSPLAKFHPADAQAARLESILPLPRVADNAWEKALVRCAGRVVVSTHALVRFRERGPADQVRGKDALALKCWMVGRLRHVVLVRSATPVPGTDDPTFDLVDFDSRMTFRVQALYEERKLIVVTTFTYHPAAMTSRM